MTSLRSQSAVSSVIQKFFQPFWRASSADVCAEQAFPVDAAVPSGPLADEVLVRMVASLLKTGRQTTALSMIERACRAKPLQPEYHNSRGLVLIACRSDIEAVAAFDTALELRPDYQEAFLNRQRVLGLARVRSA